MNTCDTDLSFNGDELHVQLPEDAGCGRAAARNGGHVALVQVHAFRRLSLGPVVASRTLRLFFNVKRSVYGRWRLDRDKRISDCSYVLVRCLHTTKQ